jgi:tetratricopeptide (TPR) repeat protein
MKANAGGHIDRDKVFGLARGETVALCIHLSAAIERSQTSPDPRLKAIQEDIERAKAEGRMTELIDVLEERAHVEGTFENWFELAYSLAEENRDADAIKSYDKALELDPKDAHAWDNKGCLLHVLGRDDDAIECYDKALELDPKDPYAWNNKGILLVPRYDAAIECYDKALALDAKYADAWNNKGVLLVHLGRYDAALECFDKILELDASDSEDADAWNNKGRSLDALGRYEAAIKCYDKALELDPWNALAAFNRCEPLFALQRWELGFAALRDAFKQYPRHTSYDVESQIHLIHTRSSGAEQLRQHVATLIAIYADAGQLTALGDRLVKSLKKIDAEMLSEKALHAWRDLWLELGANRLELEIPLRLFRVGIAYLASRDDRVLLDLLAPERRILRQALGLEPIDE